VTTLCICCNKAARDPHHPHPKSQGGKDKGEVPACRDCHSLYHAICGPQLAKTVKARVTNFGVWMSKFPGCGFMGPQEGLRPGDMAPGFVIQEAGHFLLWRVYEDFSEGCLSTLGKVTTYAPRKTIRGMGCK
jgi:hypothetical protein